MPSASQHSGRGGDPRDRRFERPQTPERRLPMAFPKGAPAAAPASGHGDPAAYRRPREGGYGGGSHHADKKHDGERKRRRHHDKDKADREARHAEKKRKTSKTVKPVEKEKKEKPKEKAPPAKEKRADSSGDDDSSSSSSDSKETVKVEERPQPKVEVDNTGAASSGAGQIMVSAISSRMDEMTAVAMSFSRSLVRAQQALRTSARIARHAAMGFESEMENFSRAEIRR